MDELQNVTPTGAEGTQLSSNNGDATYVLQDNPSETERLRMQHHVLKDAMGDHLIFAGVDMSRPGLRILDSATADGYWLEDVRHDYELGGRDPSCILVGTDVVQANFPTPEALPPGMQLRIQSITEPWPAADKASYDLVHQRMGLFATGDLLHTAVAGLIDLIKPGGWIQLVDSDLTGPESAPDNPMSASVRLIKSLLNKGPGDAYAANLKNIFKRNGLVAVQEKIVEIRIGALNPNIELAKKSTTSFLLATEGMVEAARGMPTAYPPETLDGIVPNMKEALEATGAVYQYWVVWGQKPFQLVVASS